MAHTFGSLRHTTSGRRRKPLPKKRNTYTPNFAPLKESDYYRRDIIEYSSAKESGSATEVVDRSGWADSCRYTIAPAYNKGAYQVISRENVKDIGR